MEKEMKIYDSLLKHYQAVLGEGREVIYLGLYGSQNYGLETENSDVDTKAIVVPSFKELVFAERLVSKEINPVDKEICLVQDIRHIINSWKKQNINFIEVLFTRYHMAPNSFFYNTIIPEREKIARYDESKAIGTMINMARGKFNALFNPSPSTLNDIVVYGYSPKNFHHLMRLQEFIHNYLAGMDYEKCLITYSNKDLLMAAKNANMSLEQVNSMALDAMIDLESIEESSKDIPLSNYYSYINEMFEWFTYELIRMQIKDHI